MVGETIQNYRIVEKLGQGGMGTVYKALDVRLNRFLALKFLSPERVTADRKRRFFQEAKAASALNHPNIVHIYDVGEWEGADYIAMEHVEGRTLQQILKDGPLPLAEALRYAIQIADAMSVAHSANIVHRDLKPANVMVTSRGLVKILDFGVAKLNDSTHPAAPVTINTPDETLTVADTGQTAAGMIVGSPAYMSPEQAMGKPVDARSDIFEFGLLLHEMLTGKPAFSGGSQMEILSAIIRTDPPKTSTINSAVPPELEWVIAHCLRKDRERRFQSMSEVRVALEDLQSDPSVSGIRPHTLSDSRIGGADVSPARHRTWVWGLVTALGLLCTTGLAILLLLRPWKQSAAPPNVPTELTRITNEGGLCIDAAISPDGKMLAYASDRSGEGNFDIWVRQVAGGDAMRLTHDPGDDVEPNFSPDGTRIVFRSSRQGGGLYMISALGSEERKIIDGGRQPQFSPDGSKIAYWNGPADPLPLREGIAHAYILDLSSSKTSQIRPDFAAAEHPVWSPDGRHIVFVGLKDAKDMNTFDWWVAAADGSKAVMCPMIGDYFSYDPFAWRGDHVYLTKEDKGRVTIGEVRLDPKTFQPVGTPHPLTSGTTNEYGPSVSKDGKLVFASIESNPDVFSIGLEVNRGKAHGASDRLTTAAGEDIARSVSFDGTKLAFNSDRTGTVQVWVKDLVSGKERQLTTGSEKARGLVSPDGTSVAWRESSVSDQRIFLTPFEGGLPREVCPDCGVPSGWSPDGRYLVYHSTSLRHSSIGLLEVATGKKIEYLKSASEQYAHGTISRDGKWMVFASQRSVRDFTLYAAPFDLNRPPPRNEWVEITRSPEVDPATQWSPDGGLLYFSSDRDGYNCLWALRLDRATKHPQGPLFAVQHFHLPSQVLVAPAFWASPTLGPDKVFVSLKQRSGGVWMLNVGN